MLTKRIISTFSRFIRPRVSQYESITELSNDRSTEIKWIERINKSTLEDRKENPYFALENELKMKPEVIESSLNKIIEVNGYTPVSHAKHIVRYNIVTGEQQLDLLPNDLEDPYSTRIDFIKKHYSLSQREVPLIDEYHLNNQSIVLFNLPDQTSETEIVQAFRNYRVSKVKIGYCVLGLPAYAKIEFESQSEVTNLISSKKEYVQIGQRYCYFNTPLDSQRLRLANRLVFIQGLEKEINPQHFFMTISKFGRVMHFDVPSILKKEIPVKDVKRIFADQQDSVKINLHKKDGTIESEYYPSFKQYSGINPHENHHLENLADHSQSLLTKYQRKMKFAENIDVYEDQIGRIKAENRGFAIIAYSCAEEAQNCYFALKNLYRMGLVKGNFEFHFDKPFKQRLLRFIDNENLSEKVANSEEMNVAKEAFKLGMNMMEKLRYEQAYFDGQENQQPGNKSELYYEYKNYLNRIEEIKEGVGRRSSHGKSLDQLAEMELFGRMLPKRHHKPHLKLQNLDSKSEKPFYDFSAPYEQGIPKPEQIIAKQLRIKRRKERIQKSDSRLDPELGDSEVLQAIQGVQQVPDQEFQQDPAQQYEGKRHFSTARLLRKARDMTPSQIAHRSLKFNEFVRDTINEYLGIFSEEKLESNYSSDQATLVNPHRVQFSDGTEFLSEDDLPKVLEFHRNPEEAQLLFESHVRLNEIFKSRSLSVEQQILGKIGTVSSRWQGLVDFEDTGIVSQIFELEAPEGQDIDKTVDELNAVDASFGEEYSKVNRDGKDYIVKVKKIDHIYRLDKIKKMEKFQEDMEKKVQQQPQKLAVMEKYFDQIMSTGKIPEQVRQVFQTNQQDFSMDELFSAVGVEHGIWKKDIEMLLNLENYSQAQIGKDIGMQLQAEKARSKRRPVKETDYAKDPSNVDVMNEDGEFEVSKFRQI